MLQIDLTINYTILSEFIESYNLLFIHLELSIVQNLMKDQIMS